MNLSSPARPTLISHETGVNESYNGDETADIVAVIQVAKREKEGNTYSRSLNILVLRIYGGDRQEIF